MFLPYKKKINLHNWEKAKIFTRKTRKLKKEKKKKYRKRSERFLCKIQLFRHQNLLMPHLSINPK